MKKTVLISVVAMLGATSILLSGCSTIVNGSKQQVRINSLPHDATVTVDGQRYETPASITLKGDSAGYNVVAEKRGYKNAYAHIDSSFRVGTTIFGNILWLIPGLIVDLISGSAYELQKNVDIDMHKK